MEYRALFRAISVLLCIVTVFMLPSLIVSIVFKESLIIVRAFSIPLFIGLLSFIFSFLIASEKVILSPRSGYLFVVFSWIASAVLGALPFILSSSIPSIPDALFESMSGFTTTGASILTDIEVLPKSILLWRSTTHWLGGMGIVVLTVAIFPLLGINGRALMEAEAPGPQVDKFSPRFSQTATLLWLIYLGLTCVLIFLLYLGKMSFLDSVNHAFATMATGGFSTKNNSVANFNSAYIDGVLTIFMILAGSSFTIHWKLLNRKFGSVIKDSEWRLYLSIFFVASLFVTFNTLSSNYYSNFGTAFRFASFQIASILTTTGFVTADYLQWPPFSQTLVFTMMFIGGCAGSTGGGIKVSRILTLFKMGLAEMKYLINPRGIYGIFVNKQYMRKNIVYDIAAMVYLYLGSLLISTLVVSFGGYDVLTSLTASLASLGNIGPGFSLVGPISNYAFFPSWIKIWLFFVMLLGRLEVYTVLIIFTRAFWKR